MPWADEDKFWEIYRASGPQAATDWLHAQSDERGFLRSDGTSSGTHWQAQSAWGPLLITVNEAKPEKDPRDIAAAAKEKPAEGPSECVFCWDSPNEARHLRIPLQLDGRDFSFHYSPYAYFPEHCIVATREHIPQRIDVRTFADLLDLCDLFPHYFFGANADLPIVGGSILAHHHYQGGNFTFPLDDAPVQTVLTAAPHDPELEDALCQELPPALVQMVAQMRDLPDVAVSLVQWPLTVIRLESRDRAQLLDAAASVLQWWQGYSNAATGVVAFDEDGTPHNTVTPIARKHDDVYRLDLVLRCNVTSAKHPLGVFHPHEEVHCVKKENIGLIEAMGLAILPPRVNENFAIAVADSPDRQRVGDLFALGLEQCAVLPEALTSRRSCRAARL